MRQQFIDALAANEATFGIEISPEKRETLADYYELLLEHNPILHLVAPCSPAEFATRHVLESLTMLEHLPQNARFADIGSGGGLPAIPCLIIREDLRAVLIESKEKKATFLNEAFIKCGLQDRSRMLAKQFAEVTESRFAFVTCRALDKFSERLPRLVKWADDRVLLFFGSENLRDDLKRAGRKIKVSQLMPLSERRYLYVAE